MILIHSTLDQFVRCSFVYSKTINIVIMFMAKKKGRYIQTNTASKTDAADCQQSGNENQTKKGDEKPKEIDKEWCKLATMSRLSILPNSRRGHRYHHHLCIINPHKKVSTAKQQKWRTKGME